MSEEGRGTQRVHMKESHAFRPRLVYDYRETSQQASLPRKKVVLDAVECRNFAGLATINHDSS